MHGGNVAASVPTPGWDIYVSDISNSNLFKNYIYIYIHTHTHTHTMIIGPCQNPTMGRGLVRKRNKTATLV